MGGGAAMTVKKTSEKWRGSASSVEVFLDLGVRSCNLVS